MYARRAQDQKVRKAAEEHVDVGRVMAVGTVVVWLVELLLITGPRAFRGLP
jgi:hypothetical protein